MLERGRIEKLTDELTAFRRDIHTHPETGYEEERTAARLAEELERCGLEVHRGLAATGLVATLRTGEGPTIGLRADMDALNMEERTDLPYRSTHPGKMHACGHDGHLTMLLGAARYLAREADLSGTVRFIFQPAEENLAGGKRMVDEGLFERFPVDAVFGLHNMPGMAAGRMGMRPRLAMAAADFFDLRLSGVGGHGAYPHNTRDPIVAAAQIINAWQTLISRRTDPLQSAVLSVTRIHGGGSHNVIPSEVELSGTVRTFEPAVQDRLEQGMRDMAQNIAAAHGVSAKLDYDRRYRATINEPQQAQLMLHAMRATVGADRVDPDLPATMGAEDFGWMLAARPGAYGIIGNGSDGAHGVGLHSPHYDFNDAVIPVGVAFWVNLVSAFFRGEGRGVQSAGADSNR